MMSGTGTGTGTGTSAASDAGPDPTFGLSSDTQRDLRRLFERTTGIARVWMFGSRATGRQRAESDIDLAVDAPGMAPADWAALARALEGAATLHSIDLVRWQDVASPVFRAEIERDRRVFWEPPQPAVAEAGTAFEFKPFQHEALASLDRYIAALKEHADGAQALAHTLRERGRLDLAFDAGDFPKLAWAQLRRQGALPERHATTPHSSRFDGAERPIPNVCLKLPTGGGKTLLAAAGIARVFGSWFSAHTGLVLWVVPNDAIYRQTLKTLGDRDHPYRQMLNLAGAGRVKILEKTAPLSRLDTDSHLCVMVLMLAAAARQSKDTLRFFRDRGNVRGFLPAEDDIEAHWALLQAVPNLDAYASVHQSSREARAQKGSIVKSSLGNVMRLLRPMVIVDEGHHGYTEIALQTLDGFNPGFLLELSATPRERSASGIGPNILVDVHGADLDAAEMIKLPIHVDVQPWSDWKSCLAASLHKLDALQREADTLQAETARYLRPILLVQVERVGADLEDAGYIHAQHARAYLLQLGLRPDEIAEKTSVKDELRQPENIDLLSPQCRIRVIITKQALQEGWDCPYAYVLCALAASRNPRAMTQLVGRLLRQPQTVKTGRAALDSCHVLCHDTRTADVVQQIKAALETEGLGDLAGRVRSGGGGAGDDGPPPVRQRRRPAFAALRLVVPRVTWVPPAASQHPRRELDYDSDVLAHIPWHAFDTSALAPTWAPDAQGGIARRFDLDLTILRSGAQIGQGAVQNEPPQQARIDRARLVRALTDLAPNAWWVWAWVEVVLQRLLARPYAEAVIAASSDSLIETLRADIQRERDRLAQQVFDRLVDDGRIEFRLRADATDYELPEEALLQVDGAPAPLLRSDARGVEKSLLEPALRSNDMNGLEATFAAYLDERAALRWWHRNVARAHYGLQGWQRHKVYPDFIFCRRVADNGEQIVVLETKGLHLQGPDTDYKRRLLARLDRAFKDERSRVVGELNLGHGAIDVRCDLVFSGTWRGDMDARYFDGPTG